MLYSMYIYICICRYVYLSYFVGAPKPSSKRHPPKVSELLASNRAVVFAPEASEALWLETAIGEDVMAVFFFREQTGEMARNWLVVCSQKLSFSDVWKF